MLTKKFKSLLTTGIVLIVIGVVLRNTVEEGKPINQSPRTVSPTQTLQEHSQSSSFPSQNIQRTVTIAEVYDGDTIEAADGEVIRYIGINAPETGQPYASEATELNKKLVLNKTVGIVMDIQTKDRYGRTLAYVYLSPSSQGLEATFVNRELIKNGVAIAATFQPNVAYQDTLLAAQKEARDTCQGMWKTLCEQGDNSILGENKQCIDIVGITANPPGDDNKNKNSEWVEIKNSCEDAISMNGWILKDNSASNSYQFKSITLSAGSSILLHSGCGTDTERDIYWECPERKYAVWNNDGDHAFLYDENGNLVVDYSY